MRRRDLFQAQQPLGRSLRARVCVDDAGNSLYPTIPHPSGFRTFAGVSMTEVSSSAQTRSVSASKLPPSAQL
jgi:hypothetical protein